MNALGSVRRARIFVTLITVVVIVLLALAERQAHATYAASYEPWEWDPQPQLDRRPPGKPVVTLLRLYRGRTRDSEVTTIVKRPGLPDTTETIYTHSSGSELGSLAISLLSTDDHTPQDSLGWRLRVVAGELQGIPSYIFRILPIRNTEAGAPEVYFHWRDVGGVEPDSCCPIRAALLATCVDKAGNESAPSDTLWVISKGRY